MCWYHGDKMLLEIEIPFMKTIRHKRIGDSEACTFQSKRISRVTSADQACKSTTLT